MVERLEDTWIALGIGSLSFSCSIKDVQTHLVCGKERLSNETDEEATVRWWGLVNTLLHISGTLMMNGSGYDKSNQEGSRVSGDREDPPIHPERSRLSRADCGASVAPAALMMVGVVILQARLESYYGMQAIWYPGSP